MAHILQPRPLKILYLSPKDLIKRNIGKLFEDVGIWDFSISRHLIYRADIIRYKMPTGCNDLPYIARTLKNRFR